MAMWMEEPCGRGFYEPQPWDHESEAVERYERPEPLLARPKPSLMMTPEEWFAYERGERWCLRCKQDVAADETSCPMCGNSVIGKAA